MKSYATLLLFLIMSHSAHSSQLSIAMIQEWSAFNPVTSQLASNEALFPFILRKMVKRSTDGGVLTDLAESVPQLKNKTAVWSIKKSAKWADGQSVNCADWWLGWQAGLNPKTSVDSRANYEKILNIEWSDKTPQLCKVTYKTDDWSYNRDLPPLLPSHIEKTIFEKNKNEVEGYDRNTSYISSPTDKALYNGPYYVSEFKLGSHLILSRNEYYFGMKPQIEKIIIKHVPDTGTLKANLLSGQINAVSAVGFPPDTALLFNEEFKSPNSKFRVHFQNSGIFQGVYFNLSNEILKDIRVREALSRTISKTDLVKAFFNNQLQAADGILSPQHPSYTATSSIYSKNKAIELLESAGWKLGPKGIREKSGKPLSFVFKTSAGLKVLENIQVYICDQFKSVGIMCVIKNEPPRVLLGQSVPHGEFDLAMFGQPIPPDASITSYFSSKDIPSEKNSWAGGNMIRVSSNELDQLLASFDRESSREKRNSLMKKIDSYFQKNYLLIPLYHRREALVMPKNLSGITGSFEGTTYVDPENWKIN